MVDLGLELDTIASREAFSGVVRVDSPDRPVLERAYGLADRRHAIPNEAGTQFGIASGTKSLTALTVVSLIEEGLIELSTTARSLLGDDLPLIDADVTIEHLLSHRSGIGDYLDEEVEIDYDAYLMPVPVHELATTEQYLPILAGAATKFRAGERFGYCNSGFVVLALIAERVSGVPFPELVRERVCGPAGMADTAFLRSDELPGSAAIGYLEVDGAWRTNVFHLPVRGTGDGGIYTTVADISALWNAFFSGRIVSLDWVAEIVRSRSDVPAESGAVARRYGLGFWLNASTDAVTISGGDTGVSFRSSRDPHSSATFTAISNTGAGMGALTRYLEELLF
ncbi:serine hydrolase domain-containing protein [Gaiella sp.]|uniref:serine hydrolase domain-containing protein n=1 Tax=Gaiella sp. TaxID=2663207 RepID=UPI003265C522